MLLCSATGLERTMVTAIEAIVPLFGRVVTDWLAPILETIKPIFRQTRGIAWSKSFPG